MEQAVSAWWLQVAATLLAGLSLWLVQRHSARMDALEKTDRDQRDAIHEIRLQMARELPTKDDVREVKQHVESLAATMGEIRDMVIRLDAQHATQR